MTVLKQIVAMGLSVLMMLMLSGAVLAQEVIPTLLITSVPFQGGAGTAISITGSGADPSARVTVALVPQSDSLAGAVDSATLTPDPDGTFEARLVVPANVAGGLYYIRAEQTGANGTVTQFYWNQFTILGSGTTPPDSGGSVPPGSLPTTGDAPLESALVPLMLAVLACAGLVGRGMYAVLMKSRHG